MAKTVKELIEKKRTKKRELNLNKKVNNHIKKMKAEKDIEELNMQITRAIEAERLEQIQRNLETLDRGGGIKSNEFWKLKQRINPKKVDTASKITKNGKECITSEEIKEAYKEHYQDILKTSEIDESCRVIQDITDQRFKKCTESAMNSMTESISEEELNTVIKNLKNNKAPGSDEITNEMTKKGGKDLITSLKNVYNKILKEKKCPSDWRKVKIKSIYKNKGEKEDLNNQRGIFLTSTLQKIFERIILNRQYSKIDSAISECQNGARKNRSSTEHLFILRAMLD